MIIGDQDRDHEAANGNDTRTSPPVSDGPALIRPPRAATRCRIDLAYGAVLGIAIPLAVCQPIHLASVMLGYRPLDLIGWGGTALGFAAAGWALLRMNNDDFDLPPDPLR